MARRVAALVLVLAACGSDPMPQSPDAAVPADAWPPCDAPPGRRLLYEQGTYMYPRDVVLADPITGCRIRVTEEPVDFQGLQWSGNGGWFAWDERAQGTPAWLAYAGGDTPVTFALDDAALPELDAFSPDGHQVVVFRDDDVGLIALGEELGPSVTLELPGGYTWMYTAWSPDASHLALFGMREIGEVDRAWYVVDLRGAAPAAGWRIEEDAAFLAWSPDSSRIAMLRTAGGAGQAASVVDVEDRIVRPVLVDAGTDYISRVPVWSPDGTRVLLSRIDGVAPPVLVAAVPETGTITAQPVGPPEATGREPGWLPDGTLHYGGALEGDRAGLFLVGATDPTPELLTGAADIWAYSWSPDGTMVVAETGDFEGEVLRFDRTGGPATVACPDGAFLRQMGGNVTEPWSPDSARYICYDYSEPVASFAIVAAATGEVTTLVGAPYDWPTWSPDGTLISTEYSGSVTVYDPATGALVFADEGGSDARWQPAIR